MTTLTGLTAFVTGVLILATALVSLDAYRRRREAHRLDILAFVLAVAVVRLIRVQGNALETVLLAVHVLIPWLAVRLVQHFFDVPRRVWAAVTLGAVLCGIALLWADRATFTLGHAAYTGLVMAGVGTVFTREFVRSGGVVRRRLLMAGVGAWLLVGGSILVLVAGGLGPDAQLAIGIGLQYLSSGMLACFFVAFATPQFLCRRWQQLEQARFLAETAERDPDARGAHAAADLCEATARCVSNGMAFVALVGRPGGRSLTIRAATDAELIGKPIVPSEGVLSRAWRHTEPAIGLVRAVPESVRSHLERHGATILVAPVAASGEVWGVVGVVQRRGSLFPDDDLRLMAALGRSAASALDHARLLGDARAREKLTTDQRLREVETRMAVMLDSIKDFAMLIVDDRGRVVNWHGGGEHLFGYGVHEVLDTAAAPLFDLSEEALRLLLREARELGLARREGTCRRRDGTGFLGLTVLRPLAAGDGVAGFVAVVKDVTEQRDLEERLQQSQKMEAVGQLAGGIAHDFNNLLTAIQGYSHRLVDAIPEADHHRRHAEEIRKASERASGLTRQLLTFSRRELVEAEVVNLSRVVADLLPMLERVIGDDIEIVSEVGDDEVPILANTTQLEQVVVNLAVNARDAMLSGGRLTVHTGLVTFEVAPRGTELAPGRYALLEVADTGHGMDETTRARIFEPFYTTKEPGEGTGLGLATVYGIVRQMGGAIQVRSALNEGSTFRLYFPETTAQARLASAESPTSTTGDETILVVEDDEAVRRFIGDVLRSNGYAVLEAAESAHARRAVQAWARPIHLIVTDVVMPRGSGPELVRALAQVLPGVPALFISGYADETLTRRVTLPQGSHFLQKPFSAGELLARIRQLLSTET